MILIALIKWNKLTCMTGMKNNENNLNQIRLWYIRWLWRKWRKYKQEMHITHPLLPSTLFMKTPGQRWLTTLFNTEMPGSLNTSKWKTNINFYREILQRKKRTRRLIEILIIMEYIYLDQSVDVWNFTLCKSIYISQERQSIRDFCMWQSSYVCIQYPPKR